MLTTQRESKLSDAKHTCSFGKSLRHFARRPAAQWWSIQVLMFAASQLFALPRTVIFVLCEQRWIFWFWRRAYSIRMTSRHLSTVKIGANRINWIDI